MCGSTSPDPHSVLLETGLPPSRLGLEITEGVLIDDFSRAVATLRKLKALGVCIDMVDFGTGYSSLSYLPSTRSRSINPSSPISGKTTSPRPLFAR
jgi:EAL domain-containing protein (putative c-di-GMP-specific phosphodiesterase class I)